MTTPASLSGTPCPPHAFPSEAISVYGPLSAEIALSGRVRAAVLRCCGAAVLRCCGAAVLRCCVASCLHGHAHVCGVGRACMVYVRGGVCLRLRSHLAEEIASRGGRLEGICRGHLKRPGHREARRAADRARSRQVAADRARCGRARRARA